MSKTRTVYTQETFHYDAFRLLRYLESLALPLHTLHVSIYGTEITDELQMEFNKLVALGTKDLAARELTPSRISSMNNQLQNTITTLNLFGYKMCGVDDVLHQYLCSSPHLSHLRAPNTAHLVNHFDIYQRLESTRSGFLVNSHGSVANSSAYQPGIWKCGKLRTLHLGFHTLDPNMYAFSTSQHTQILFGYIFLVCPHLEDLFVHGTGELEMNVVNPAVDLEPGLLLLTRLKGLKVMKVGKTLRRMVKYNMYRPQACRMPWDGDEEKEVGVSKEFTWMVPTGHTEPMREAMKKDAEGLMKAILYERFADAQSQSRDDNSNTNINSNNGYAVPRSAKQGHQEYVDALLKKALKDLGRIRDVKNAIDEMAATKGYVCWFEIRRVAVFSEDPFSLPVEREYQRLISQR